MPDFAQNGEITTIPDFQTASLEQLEVLLRSATRRKKIGLVLPVTASDMRAEPFDRIVRELVDADYIHTIAITFGVAPSPDDYREMLAKVAPLGDRVTVLWTDGPRIANLYNELNQAGLALQTPGKGRSVWTAFGFLLADPSLTVFALHDCDIVDYDRVLLARLCLPMVQPSLDFEFCKAFYARVTDRMNGRVVRLLVAPLLHALMQSYRDDEFIRYLASFRYPLSGEFAVTSNLARSNRIPSDWGLEVGTLSEVFRNTSVKRVCQVDLCRLYEHKHQALSLDDDSKGLMKMATDILTTIYRTLASRGVVFSQGHFVTLRAAYLRSAQDSIRKYHADAILNGIEFDRHGEEEAVEGFAQRVMAAGELFHADPEGAEAVPNWTRVLTAFPDFPEALRQAAIDDACGAQ